MINIESVRTYLLSLPHVTEDMPFDKTTLVFRVGNKMFALTGLDRSPAAFNLKCDPEKAIDLREQYEDVQPGYHMNKKHWNTVTIEGQLPWSLLKEMIDHSYDLIYSSLPEKVKAELEAL